MTSVSLVVADVPASPPPRSLISPRKTHQQTSWYSWDETLTYNKLMAWVRFCSFWIYPSLACLLLSLSLQQRPSWKQLLWLIPLGWLIWSLLEYLLHRVFFHWSPHHRRIKKIVQSLHFKPSWRSQAS